MCWCGYNAVLNGSCELSFFYNTIKRQKCQSPLYWNNWQKTVVGAVNYSGYPGQDSSYPT
jgi:hypothetical protein